jgi:hypothetical protein
MGFHAPQEAARVLGAIDYARQGQIAAMTATTATTAAPAREPAPAASPAPAQ